MNRAIVPESDSPFSIEKTNRLRGMLILGIFVFHFCSFFPTDVRPDVGHLLVGVFFMLSGFGLMESYIKKPGYLDDFIGKKITRLLVPIWVAGLIVLLVHWFVYNNHSIINEQVYLFDIISGGSTSTDTWFVVELIFFYLIFYIAFKYLKPKFAIIAVFIAITVLMIALSFQQGMWAASGMMFPVGLLLSYYGGKIELIKPYIVLLFAVFISVVFAYYMKIPRISPVSSLVFGNLQCLLVALFVISYLLIRKKDTKNWLLVLLLCNIVYYSLEKSLMLGPNIISVLPFITVFLILAGLNTLSPVTKFIGDISYEFYIIHAIMIGVSKVWFSDMLLCFICSLLLSVIAAFVIKKVSGLFFDNKKDKPAPVG